MIKTVIFLLLMPWAFCVAGNVTYAGPDNSAEANTTNSTSSAGGVLSHFFDLLHKGNSSEAQELFRIHNPDQEAVVGIYVTNGIKFFTKANINNAVVMTFKNDKLAICAIEQSSSDYPGKYELESGAMIIDGGSWKLLPQAQDYRATINGLSAKELAGFDELQKEFYSFKSKWQQR